jgi:hypothetical protein
MKCPHCGHELNAGSQLGKLGKGHKKTMSPEMIEQRKAASAKGVAARQAKKRAGKVEQL